MSRGLKWKRWSLLLIKAASSAIILSSPADVEGRKGVETAAEAACRSSRLPRGRDAQGNCVFVLGSKCVGGPLVRVRQRAFPTHLICPEKGKRLAVSWGGGMGWLKKKAVLRNKRIG